MVVIVNPQHKRGVPFWLFLGLIVLASVLGFLLGEVWAELDYEQTAQIMFALWG